MRKQQGAAFVFGAAILAVAIGCGGGGGENLNGGSGGTGGSGGSGGGGALQEQGTARVDVDPQTGAVTITPLGMAPGSNQSRSLYTGSAVSLTSTPLSTDASELTVKKLKLTILNNTADDISNARLIVDRISTDVGGSLDLREYSNVATIIGPGSSGSDGPGPGVTIASPSGLVRDTDGTVYIAGSGDGHLRKYKDNYVTRIATGLTSPGGVAVHGGFAFVLEQTAHNLSRVLTSGGTKFVMAGNGTAGLVDGSGAAARFNTPRDIEVIGTTAFISDLNNDRIRKATNLTGGSAAITTLNVFPVIARPSGLAHLNLAGIDWLVVTSSTAHRVYLVNSANGQSFVIAGTGAASTVDGPGTTAAFNTPFDATVENGAIFISDLGGRKIRQVMLNEGAQPQFAASWTVKTVAGAGTNGAADGIGTTAQFGSPRYLETDGSGAILVNDLTNNRTRKLTPVSGVFPVTGSGGSTSGTVHVIGMDGYVPDPVQSNNRKPFFNVSDLSPKGSEGDQTTIDLNFTVASNVGRFFFIVSLSAEANSTPAALDAVLNATTPLLGSPNVNVRTLAGGGGAGWVDGEATIAQFSSQPFVAASDIGIFVSDLGNSSIRFIDLSGTVYTIAGVRGVTSGTPAGGTGATCVFNTPSAIWANRAGTVLYVCDFLGRVVFRLERNPSNSPHLPSAWQVTIIAGAPNTAGNEVGNGQTARFLQLYGIAADASGRTVYVADASAHCVKQLAFNGSNFSDPTQWGVSFYAGSTTSQSGDADGNGTSARFWGPAGLALGLNGELYVAEALGHRVRRIDFQKNVTLLAGSATGVLGDADGVGAAARFNSPQSIAVDEAGYAYVTNSYLIRRINIATGETRTLAGTTEQNNRIDGPGHTASFFSAQSISYHPRRGLIFGDYPSRIGLIERIVRNGQP